MIDMLYNIWNLFVNFIMAIYNWICANLIPTFGVVGTIVILIVILMILKK